LYWLTEALEILNVQGYELTEDKKSRCVSYLRQCQNKKEGGFGGAPYL
jgi:prenyltransferase beta subunit